MCSSLTRIVVSRHRHDELLDALPSTFSQVKVEDPFTEGAGMRPLAEFADETRLNASVLTDDVDRARDVARRLRSGTVGHNAMRTDR